MPIFSARNGWLMGWFSWSKPTTIWRTLKHGYSSNGIQDVCSSNADHALLWYHHGNLRCGEACDFPERKHYPKLYCSECIPTCADAFHTRGHVRRTAIRTRTISITTSFLMQSLWIGKRSSGISTVTCKCHCEQGFHSLRHFIFHTDSYYNYQHLWAPPTNTGSILD